ncbi:class I SAM-dependent DNA methyltransferase [Rhodoferax antarcticus]|uniref:site-specific DNA-methyltransferase (adenine-specific) n=1 Tax=Rhodoferax antarcticus ANT.BR TaxID=1111071 RepID=A0A1Q8YAK8_9BURK|nr:DNA methyltransferase [Rhodoferax antarcticus]OLP05116.1 mmeI [Rhodoferax antarcticus ANT.BR]
MPISWNEIKSRAHAFSRTWVDAANEDSQGKPFWIDFFEIFGITNKRVATFEHAVKKLLGEKARVDGFVDLFWPGMLLVEQKSRGKNLDAALTQALSYFPGIAERDLPQIIIVCDFARFRVHRLATGETVEFALKDLHKHIKIFGFVAGYKALEIKPQDPVNIKAAFALGRLHDALKASGYTDHPLEVLLVRLLFCLFADDTGIFQPAQAFRAFIEERTATDGSDLGSRLGQLFQILNTADGAGSVGNHENKRSKALDEQVAAFPYVNGKLFDEPLPMADFSAAMREALLDACALDWSAISPAIFGSLFQSIMDDKARRNLGAHYTSEENILKLIKPLFLDELWAEFGKVKSNKNRLFEFHKKLRTLTFFDPACGCGNFLVISYRELRLLELEVLRASNTAGQLSVDVHQLIGVNVDQFYGIEIEEFPAQIAQVALWLMDHQMNLRVSEEFGLYFARIPLRTTPHVVHGNALRLDWNEVLPVERCSYVLGNPPFIGKKEQSVAQKADFAPVMTAVHGAGVLDFVSAWYVKATQYVRGDAPARARQMPGAHTLRFLKSPPTSAPPTPHWTDEAQANGGQIPISGTNAGKTTVATTNLGSDPYLPDHIPITRCAFVSTNSITQGEQVGVLWGWMLAQHMHIHFAHRTFSWSNEASGKAAVHCVIIGFGLEDRPGKMIYEYDDVRGKPHAVTVGNISPYLTDTPSVVVCKRATPICPAPEIVFGSKAVDFGHFILEEAELDGFLKKEPQAKPYIREYIGGEEFLNGTKRFCLWLKDIPPGQLRAMPEVLKRVEAVKAERLKSVKAPTRELAKTPSEFGENRQPSTPYLLIPKVSSENRDYVPLGFFGPEVIINPSVLVVPQAGLLELGVLQSAMHMAWMRATAGRMKSDYQYSAQIVYNNFPWPDLPKTSEQNQPPAPVHKAQAAIETAAQAVLDARAQFQTGEHPASLADLYDPLTMPSVLLKAHQKLDAAVDAAYASSGGKKTWKSDAERVAYLFELYQRYTSLLPVTAAKPKRKSKNVIRNREKNEWPSF